jgi:hypothetical protein
MFRNQGGIQEFTERESPNNDTSIQKLCVDFKKLSFCELVVACFPWDYWGSQGFTRATPRLGNTQICFSNLIKRSLRNLMSFKSMWPGRRTGSSVHRQGSAQNAKQTFWCPHSSS